MAAAELAATSRAYQIARGQPLAPDEVELAWQEFKAAVIAATSVELHRDLAQHYARILAALGSFDRDEQTRLARPLVHHVNGTPEWVASVVARGSQTPEMRREILDRRPVLAVWLQLRDRRAAARQVEYEAQQRAAAARHHAALPAFVIAKIRSGGHDLLLVEGGKIAVTPGAVLDADSLATIRARRPEIVAILHSEAAARRPQIVA